MKIYLSELNSEVFVLNKKVKSGRKKGKIIKLVVIIVIVVVVIGVAIWIVPRYLGKNSGDEPELIRTKALVQRGDIARSIGVSSSIVPSETEDYFSSYASEVLEVAVSEGDFVLKDDIVIRLSTEVTDDMVDGIEDQIEVLREQIDNLIDTIDENYSEIETQNEMIDDRNSDIAGLYTEISDIEGEIAENEANRVNLNIPAPIDGTVLSINTSVGDIVGPGSVVAVIINPFEFTVEIPFPAAYLDEEVNLVQVHYLGMDFDAVISSVSSYTYYDRRQNEVVDTILTFTSDVSIAPGETVTASIRTDEAYYYMNEGEVPEYSYSENVIAEVSGEVLSINMTEKQPVTAGDIIVVIDGENLSEITDSLRELISSHEDQIDVLIDANELSLEIISNLTESIPEYEDDIAGIEDDVKELEEDLAEARNGYAEAEIKAGFDGYVISLSVDEGDDIAGGLKLFTLVSMNNPRLYLTIDELDIPELKEGLAAEVTIDALTFTEETPIAATVTGIALSGNAQGGVTTYSVEVELSESVDGLRPGMSGTGTIFISKKANTLYVPIEAVSIVDGKSYVWVTDSKSNVGTANDKKSYSGKKDNSGRPVEKDTSKMTAQQKTDYENYKKGFESEKADYPEDNAVSTLDEYYEGAVSVEVTTGIHNETQIEILSGLEEGQIVLLPPIYDSTSTDSESGGFGIGAARKAIGGYGK
jgi:HlyD family secretion protein